MGKTRKVSGLVQVRVLTINHPVSTSAETYKLLLFNYLSCITLR